MLMDGPKVSWGPPVATMSEVSVSDDLASTAMIAGAWPVPWGRKAKRLARLLTPFCPVDAEAEHQNCSVPTRSLPSDQAATAAPVPPRVLRRYHVWSVGLCTTVMEPPLL